MSEEYMKVNGENIRKAMEADGYPMELNPDKDTSKVPYNSEERKSMKERVGELVSKLEDGLKEIFESEKYKNYLNTMAKFHNYSLNNSLLIHQQKPEATLVAGFNAWSKNFDRHVKKGEKGIQIIAPAPYTIKKEQQLFDLKTQQPLFNADGTPKMTEVEVKIPAFKVTTVFDVSQTYGKELPTLGVNELTGNVERAKDFMEALKKVSPVPVNFGETKGDSKGFYSPSDQSITIKEGMADAQTIKTMVHEISHAKLHNPEQLKEEGQQKSHGTIEMEAESVAYIVCQHFGIDTSDYSFGYIAGWSEGKGPEELRDSMQTIRDTAGEMINRVENSMRAMERDREVAQEKEAMTELPVEEPVKPKTDQTKDFEAAKDADVPFIQPIDKEVTKAGVDAAKTANAKDKEAPKEERKSLKAKLSEKKKEVAKEKKDKTLTKEKDKTKGGAR